MPPFQLFRMDNTPLSTSDQSLRSPDRTEPTLPPSGVFSNLLDELPEDDMSPLFPGPKQSGGTARWFWLIFLASLGLHGIFLFLPTGEEAKPPPPKPPENQVRITQLPTAAKQPVIKRPPKPAVKRSATPTASRPRVNVPPPPSVPAPPKPAKAETKADAAVETEAKPSTESDAWKDFPLYPGSTPGCFELPSCLQSSDGFSQVVDHFATQLPEKKYTLKPVVQESGRTVYEVTRDGLTQFLSIIENGKNTVYVLSDAPRTIADLEQAVEVPPEIYAILVGLAVQQADSTAFTQPDQFYTQGDRKLGAATLVPKAGIRNISLVSGQGADTMMDELLRSNLQNSEFEVTDLPKTYGGGKLYRAQKEDKALYLNLVPTKDNSGTLLVIWNTPPD